MKRGTRTATLIAAAVVFVIGSLIGVRMLISSPEPAPVAATCRDTVIAAGATLDSNVVRVNVFNASNRSGLANRVLINLQANGFRGGQIGNSTSANTPKRVMILTKDPEDPRVRLVAQQFEDKVEFAEPDVTAEDGVIVLVGDDYSGLRENPDTTIESDREIRACVPNVTVP